MPTVTTPTISRAATEVAKRFTVRLLVKLILSTMVLFSVIAGIHTQNPVVLLGALGSVILFILVGCWYVFRIKERFQFLWAWLRHGVDRDTARRTYLPKPSYRLSSEDDSPMPVGDLLQFVAISLPLFASAFIFTAKGTADIWVIGSKPAIKSDTAIGVPFVQTIKTFRNGYNVKTTATAITADGIKVQGSIAMRFMFKVNDKQTILRVANASADPATTIQDGGKRALEARLVEVVQHRKLAELPSTMTLEYETGKGIDQETLDLVGLYPEGMLEITDLHPFFASR